MKTKEFCPVCDAELKVEEFYLDGHTLEESYRKCPNRDYWHEYAYGSTTIVVGKKQFGGFYLDTLEKSELRQKDVDAEVKRLRDWNRRKKVALSVMTALVMPGGLVIVPLYHWLKRKKAQGRKP